MLGMRTSLPLAVALVLAGCSFTIPIPTDDVVAGIDPNTVAASPFIDPGERLVLRVVNSTLRDLLVAEAVGVNLRVTLLTEGYATLAMSEQPEFFARSVLGLAGTPLVPESVIPAAFCRGPCVTIVPMPGARYLLEIWNRSNVRQRIPLYVFGVSASDPNDRGGANNDSIGTATPVPTGDVGGVIEVIDDVDWFRFTGTEDAILTFYPSREELGLRFQFEDQTQAVSGSLTPVIVRPGERFRVFSNVHRAGPSGTAGYVITIERD